VSASGGLLVGSKPCSHVILSDPEQGETTIPCACVSFLAHFMSFMLSPAASGSPGRARLDGAAAAAGKANQPAWPRQPQSVVTPRAAEGRTSSQGAAAAAAGGAASRGLRDGMAAGGLQGSCSAALAAAAQAHPASQSNQGQSSKEPQQPAGM